MQRTITGLEYYTEDEVVKMLRTDFENIISECDLDIEILELWLHGSRLRHTSRTDSDLDVVLFYKGSEREDTLFNIFNDDEYSIEIDNIHIDVNPVKANSVSDIMNYKRKSDEYDNEIIGNRPVKTFEQYINKVS